MEKKFFKKLFNQLPYGVLLINENGEVVFQNKTAGILLLEIYTGTIGSNFFELLNHSPVKYSVQDALNKKIAFRKEFEISADTIVQIDGDPYNDQLCPNGILLSIYSISQFKKLEKHNRQFVANVSHELKTPLTAIIGYIETMIDSNGLSKEINEKFLQIIKKNSLRLSQIVNDLLTLSSLEKDENSKEGVKLIKAKIYKIIKESMTACEYKASAKNVQFSFEGNKDIECMINSGLLEQAFVNIIDNGIKFSPDGSVLNINLSETSKNAVVRISDFGPGIPSKYHARIFERFFSVDKARSRTLGGSGLGLSIVKHIIINHHGHVYVEDNTPHGATFTVIIPKVTI